MTRERKKGGEWDSEREREEGREGGGTIKPKANSFICFAMDMYSVYSISNKIYEKNTHTHK